MKKLLLLLAILFRFSFSFAQAYQPFLVDGAHWTIEEDYCVGQDCDPANPPDANGCYVSSIYDFKLDGDTIVDSFVYKKLLQNIFTTVNTGYQGPCEWPVPPEVVTCGVVGLLWEDTTARKVYIHKTNYPTSFQWHPTDSVFFDFSLQVGDTFYNKIFADTSFVVDSINYNGFTSVDYQNFPVKTWYLHCVQDTNFIYIANMQFYESIGASVGFFGYQPAFEGEYSTRLKNYSIGTDSAAGFVCMDPSLGIRNLTKNISVSVHPNPAKDVLTVDMRNMSPGEHLQFLLTDILGQGISTQTITNARTDIDVSGFASGIYLWHLLSDGNIVSSGKVVHD